MPKILIKEQEHKIEVPILLTAVSGKMIFNESEIKKLTEVAKLELVSILKRS